jgi:N-acylneuraminate cytidylyltransferase
VADSARADTDRGAASVEVLALVPARGGSKGIPGKNLIDFLGRPLVEWSIAAALDAKLVTRVAVSTDDDKIAEVSLAAGAEVPFRRPPELSGDLVPDFPVFEHALQWFAQEEGYEPEIVVHLRPTSPVRPPGLIDEGIRRLIEAPNAHSLRAVCEPMENPFKMWRIENDLLTPLVDSGVVEGYNRPRQELPDVYWHCGTLDVVRATTILDRRSISGTVILPFVIDSSLAVDIDDLRSLRHAAQIARELGIEPR